jgi:hypothetical protein
MLLSRFSCSKCCIIICLLNERDWFGLDCSNISKLLLGRYITSCLIYDNNFLLQWSGWRRMGIWSQDGTFLPFIAHIIDLCTPDQGLLVLKNFRFIPYHSSVFFSLSVSIFVNVIISMTKRLQERTRLINYYVTAN